MTVQEIKKSYEARKAERDSRWAARPVYRLCGKCWRSWNVSRIDPPGKQDYICPDCRGTPWEGCEGDKRQETTGGEPNEPEP